MDITVMSNLPATYDFTWVRGTTTPFKVRFRHAIDESLVTFEEARLSVYKNNGRELAFRASFLLGQITQDVDGTLVFVPTSAQTRELTQTKNIGDPGKNRYEYELRTGTDERVRLMGVITAIGGLNDDQDEEIS